jgi:dynein light intermediate chain 1
MRARARGRPQSALWALYVHLTLILISFILTVASHRREAYLQPYCTLNYPLPTISSILRGTILSSGSGTFAHNIAGVPIIVACTKAVDDPTDFVGAGTSGLGGMVKGRETRSARQWEQICLQLLTMCITLHILPSLFLVLISWQMGRALCTALNPTTLIVLRQYHSMTCLTPYPRQRARRHCSPCA